MLRSKTPLLFFVLSFLFLDVLPLSGSEWEGDQIPVFSKKQSYYIISEEVDLGGKTVVLPDGATLDFRGGRIKNGRLECHNNVFSGRAGLAPGILLSGSVTGPFDLSVFELESSRSFDIGKLINVAGTVCKNLVIPDGRFYFQTPVRLENVRYYQQFGDLVYNGREKDVTTFRFDGGNASIIRIYGKIVYDTDTKIINYTTANRTNIIGLEFVNINNSDVFVGDIEYFNNNIRVSAYGAGNCYNKYTFNISVFSNEHLRIIQHNRPANQIGWCNENTFIGGRFCNWSHFDWKNCSSVAIKVEGPDSGDTYNKVNSLLFVKPSMEGFKEYAVYARNVTGCHWQDVRTEGCSTFIKFVGDCRNNEANSLYGSEAFDFSDCSTYPLKKDNLFPVYTTVSTASRTVLEVDTRKAKFFRVAFSKPGAKARVGILYLTRDGGRPIARGAQKSIARPRSTNHPNSYYFNSSSEMWLLASDASQCDFVIPKEIDKIQLVLSGQDNSATVYSDNASQVIEK